MDSGVHRNDRMDVFYKGVNIDCYGAQGAPRNDRQILTSYPIYLIFWSVAGI
jgi:hypothetical protein